jgi:hypothetical protein
MRRQWRLGLSATFDSRGLGLLCSLCSFPFRCLPPPGNDKDEDAYGVESRQNGLEGRPALVGTLDEAEQNRQALKGELGGAKPEYEAVGAPGHERSPGGPVT